MIRKYIDLKRSDFKSFDTQYEVHKIVIDHNLVSVYYRDSCSHQTIEYELIDESYTQDGSLMLVCKDTWFGGSKTFIIRQDGNVEIV